MNKQQARELIRETFESAFNKSNFTRFIKELLNRVDGETFAYQGNYIPQAYKEYIKTLERIGKYGDGENNIDILIITLQKETSLERARTMQRNFVARYLNGSRGGKMKDAALVAFVSPEEKDWRFSLVKMDYKFEQTKTGEMKVKEEFTPARRWSFLVGENERSHTAQSRLVKILINDEHDPTLKEIEEAFNIETVTREFFLKYRELFLRTKEELDRLVDKDPRIKSDFETKGVDTVNFAKKLLGQIVFLYFLQKKGWFGVARDADWGEGPKHFLRELYKKTHGDYNNFFNDIMEPLFYDALRIDRSHDDDYYSRFNCKIPFLNGGLFDPIGHYDWVHADILLPDTLFSNTDRTKEGDIGDGILDVFDRYNFTVKEDEPLDKEVAIDPELLGKAYEKFNAIRPDNYAEFKAALKSGKSGEENKFNKKFGVYYTPREIVHYMCQQSLVNYLDSELNKGPSSYEKIGDPQHAMFDNKAKKGQLDLIIEHKSGIKISKEDIETLIHIGEHVSENEARVLREGRETRTYYHKLPESIRKNAALIDEKLADITVCDPAVGSGAFPVGMMSEIVRARNVLSVFMNGQKRKVYDFKRHCIEHSLYGVDIDPGAVEIAKLRLWLSLVVDEEDIKDIKPLPNLDYKIVCGNSLLGVEKNLYNADLFKELERIKPLYFNETNPTKKQQYKTQIDNLIGQITNGHQQFDFKVHFSEVFHHKNGFDIIIANPPYVSVEKFARTALQKEWKRKFKTYASRGDIYCFFYEQGISLLGNGGVLTFISSNKFQRAGYGKGLRKLLASHRIHTIIDFCELPVFAAATDPMIVIVAKAAPDTNSEFPVLVVKDEAEISELPQSLKSRASCYKAEHLEEEGWSLEGGDSLALVEKLRSIGTSLANYVKGSIMAGIKTGYNKAFWLDSSTAKKLSKLDPTVAREFLKPLIVGDDARRWSCKPVSTYLIYIPRGTQQKRIGVFGIHLSKWRAHLEKRALNQKWFELQQAQLRYSSTWSHPKIVYPDIALEPRFSIEYNGRFPDMTAFTIPSDDRALLAILNSTTTWFFLKRTASVLGDSDGRGRVRCKTQYVSQIPIPSSSSADKSRLFLLAEQASKLTEMSDSVGVAKVEKKINQIVYQLYGLTEEEIKVVEGES
jgi:type I restriction-modification system DNA methylase subunit